ncbi:MAG UNVERIFIED_CONTAM: hypothetical protein LVR29_31475 [Microcystis novacekii LVE1205-3]
MKVFGPRTPLEQAEKVYGKGTLSYNTSNESREYVRFVNQPFLQHCIFVLLFDRKIWLEFMQNQRRNTTKQGFFKIVQLSVLLKLSKIQKYEDLQTIELIGKTN